MTALAGNQQTSTSGTTALGNDPASKPAAMATTGENHAAAATTTTSADVLPVLDLSPYLQAAAGAGAVDAAALGADAARLCAALAASLRDTGCAIVRDPRVDADANNAFIDTMEAYFSQPTEIKLRDARPQLGYQVGATPGGVETPRCVAEPATAAAAVAAQREGHKATLPTGPDPKWRFFWRLGPRPASTRFAELNAEPVVPEAFPDWPAVMDGWGSRMLAAAETVAGAAALGLGLPRAAALTALMADGPHLLAPTGADLGGGASPPAEGSVLAGFHADLNLLTVHGRARYPGLFVWLRDGRRVPVRIPPGCLLVQAGRQLEWLTGGEVLAGMHEVLVTREALDKAAAEAAAGRSTWRVSSTVFAHVASDATLEPLLECGDGYAEAAKRSAAYPPTAAGDQVRRELEAIRLLARRHE